MMDYVDDLARLVGWTGQGVPGVDWTYVESELGVVLPSDYKRIVERFPSGHFNGLEVLQPRSSDPDDVEVYLDAVFDSAEDLADAVVQMSVRPSEVFPSVPGLVPWGNIVGELVVCSYLTGRVGGLPPSYVARAPFGGWIELEGTIAECIIDMITGRVAGVSGFLSVVERPTFTVFPPPESLPPPRLESLGPHSRSWMTRDASYFALVGLAEPVDAVDSLLELRLGTGRAQFVDWFVVENALGMQLPQDYKRFIEEVGPGRYGDIVVASPNGPTADAPGVFEVLSSMREWLESTYTNPPTVLPERGGPLVWGTAPHGWYCGWQLDESPADPDLQAVMTFTSTRSMRGTNQSMTNYLNQYLREGETPRTAPWSGGPGSARRRWKRQRGRL